MFAFSLNTDLTWYWQVLEYSSYSTSFNIVSTEQNGRHYQMFLANFGISILILLKFLHRGLIAIITGVKPFPEALMVQFIDAYIHHWA